MARSSSGAGVLHTRARGTILTRGGRIADTGVRASRIPVATAEDGEPAFDRSRVGSDRPPGP